MGSALNKELACAPLTFHKCDAGTAAVQFFLMSIVLHCAKVDGLTCDRITLSPHEVGFKLIVESHCGKKEIH